MPFISVIIPVYNAQEFLPGALESIETQDFADWEVILVDDGNERSTQHSLEGCARRVHHVHGQ